MIIFLAFLGMTIWFVGFSVFFAKVCYFLSMHWLLKIIIRKREGKSLLAAIGKFAGPVK